MIGIKKAGKQHAVAIAAAQATLIYVWLTDLSALSGMDTYYSVYLLCGVAGLICLLDNRRHPSLPDHPRAIAVFSGLFALTVVLGNYELYEPFSALQNQLNAVMDFLGGFCVGYQVLCCMMRWFPLNSGSGQRNHPRGCFSGCSPQWR